MEPAEQSFFTSETSIVRKIWGTPDVVLFIFAGASAEFALNKSVDWLYFTGKLPADPIGRLFSTVAYAKQIVFAKKATAEHTISSIKDIHVHVENARGMDIPQWAYRDVLFMLIHYSIASYTLLERNLTEAEKEEVHKVFISVGRGMQIEGLPSSFIAWQPVHAQHLKDHLQHTALTADLFKQYRKHLGYFRFLLLLQCQSMVAPRHVKTLLGLKTYWLTKAMLWTYKLFRSRSQHLLKLVLPPKYRKKQYWQYLHHH